MRDRPDSVGLLPYGDAETTLPQAAPPPGHPSAGNPIRVSFRALGDGVRSRDFWLIAGSYFVCGASTNGLIGTHLIAAAEDHHMSAVAGASLLAVLGVFDAVGTIVSGWLTDRYDPRKLLAWYYALRGLAVIALPYAFGSLWTLGAFAVFYGLDWVATVPPTVALAADRFGRERAGVVFAWIFAAHQLGAAAAAWAAGASRSSFGTYTPSFLAAGVLCLAAAMLALQVRLRVAPDAEPSIAVA
jgi:predicted MFS family arabinose efflux permease